MKLERLLSPVSYLRDRLGDELLHLNHMRDYETWWEATGLGVSEIIDRAGTPWNRMFDAQGNRIDELNYPPGYHIMLGEGYRYGVVWRAFEGDLLSAFLFGYVTSFFDMGLYCPYTVSLATAISVDKYAPEAIREDFLHSLLLKDKAVWQGATWMTERMGGSDLGGGVQTTATPQEDGRWLLNGDKYFCSNVGAELAVVAARPQGAPAGVRGLSLFLVPRYRMDGMLNYHIRRLKDKIATRSVPTGEVEFHDSEAYLLGRQEHGIYLILETLNQSRVSNSFGSTAVIQRALSMAFTFARQRMVFGKPLIDQPLMRRQFERKVHELNLAFALTWESARLFNDVWREMAPHYSEKFNLFRLIVHLSKYYTAETAVQTAKWSMEVHGGIGTLAEFGVERLLREAMIADIWEGPPHRQILDGIEVMERKNGFALLAAYLEPFMDAEALNAMRQRVETLLALPQDEKEAESEAVFIDLAHLTASALLLKQAETQRTLVR